MYKAGTQEIKSEVLIDFGWHRVGHPIFVLVSGGCKAWDSSIIDLFSDTHTLGIQYEYSQTQCVGITKEVNNKRAPGLTTP